MVRKKRTLWDTKEHSNAPTVIVERPFGPEARPKAQEIDKTHRRARRARVVEFTPKKLVREVLERKKIDEKDLRITDYRMRESAKRGDIALCGNSLGVVLDERGNVFVLYEKRPEEIGASYEPVTRRYLAHNFQIRIGRLRKAGIRIEGEKFLERLDEDIIMDLIRGDYCPSP
jgi:hypothetical protein